MKRKWTHIMVRVLPIAVAVAVIAEEFEQIAGRKWS
jgi:hypothetical protein